jgi:hypothetical protein
VFNIQSPEMLEAILKKSGADELNLSIRKIIDRKLV